ncbi:MULTISPECIES: phosphoribosylformylglycinamidine synthase subunit PurS [unclassified Campylobacter]|uniref:phosphoribosylformylglycinamidine synthase subunit PurS n=1 Tax=unclassified Campylobacter TaxID=2593542 RepID=UPI0012382A3A|nr:MULTISPECIES: phosphoribosylformylglycinamidine synthase subunit PurS [unclassified Campylobacter]KAA6225527.1 phosphoribosylformylglycinamidine synthase subunit PurS [Campylobacter sp. LR196d]KAA6226964.1 phosphoribosylformylglycinamidine synthase subunit PurS [Campylobacter sp. LR185c]KAA6229798.1 phosphoribosylformylglycinamidine synthase subunit PurS [Campylobacter sp. LR286c]KAA6234323.1 phosphoribosylformylglycinamidine synthase subunit PurS [Campylobacter sp. LR291e]KAA6234542.1 phos
MKITINVFLKDGVLDPQGKATQKALHALGFHNVKDTKIAKQISIDLDESDETKARQEVEKMCEELLVNSVIEDYELVI